MRSQKMCHKKPVTIGTIMKTPVRFISKALDLYVKGVNNFSSTYNRPFSTTKVNANCHALPRSFSTSRLSDNDQLLQVGALVRSISTTATRSSDRPNNFAGSELRLYPHKLHSYASRRAAFRSCSVGMGKIDEDRVSSFRDNDFILKSALSVKNKY
ncbi:hypothetical protein Hanom_Chr09g00809111 [Helianthus anomalus]